MYNSNSPTFQRGDIRVCPQTWSRPIGRIILAHWTDTPTSCNGMIVDMTHHLLEIEMKSLFSPRPVSVVSETVDTMLIFCAYSVLFFFYYAIFYKAPVALWNRIQQKRTYKNGNNGFHQNTLILFSFYN